MRLTPTGSRRMIPFVKYSGAGNDFLIVRAGEAGSDPAELARRICARRTGAGADGLALVEPRGDGPVGIRFFNPDGSEFGTCGNGTRCVARWADDRGLAPDGASTLETSEGRIAARVRGERVRLDYRLPCRVRGRRTVPLGEERREGWLVEMGTPHLVLPMERLPEGEVEELCRPARRAEALGPEGANVNLVEVRSRGRAAIRTYERGVEGETAACGAGAMSAALALHAAGRTGRRLELETRSGEALTVELGEDAAGDVSGREVRTLRLIGPARPVYEGRFPAAGETGRAGRA